MGICYTLINYKDKTLLDLGKGCFAEWVNDRTFSYTEDDIRSVMEDYEYFLDRSASNINYWNSVVDLILNFVKDVNHEDLQMIGDGGDELYILKSYGYKFIASRHKSDVIEDLNKHLTAERQHMYNKEEASKYLSYYPNLNEKI